MPGDGSVGFARQAASPEGPTVKKSDTGATDFPRRSRDRRNVVFAGRGRNVTSISVLVFRKLLVGRSM